ncbi:MAG: site-specific integrase [Christensenellales bacterium]
MARKVVQKNISYDNVRRLFYVNMDYGKDDTGKRIKKTLSFKTQSEARQALREFEADKTKGTLITPNRMTLKNWLNYWMENVIIPNRAQTTVYGYQNIINNHINPRFGEIPLQNISAQQIQQYYKEKMRDLANPLSSNTVRKHHDLLYAALKLAVRQNIILKNPIDQVEPPRVKSIEKSFYTPEELSKLFNLVEGNRLEVTVKLAGYLGLRREEICGLKWENVDFTNQTIKIRDAVTAAGSRVILKDTKNETSSRTLSLYGDLLETLQREKAKQEKNKMQLGSSYMDSSYVVQWDDGRPYRPNYLSELFAKFIIKNNTPKIVLHELRHTFATIANAMGVSPFDIGKALGHSTPSTTAKIYTHLLDYNNKEAIRKVADALKK